MNENKYNFRIKYEKDQHSINADTYVQSLMSLSTIIKEVNYQVGNGPAVAVNVLAEDQGSFDVALQVIEVVKDNHQLITNGVTILGTIVATAVGLIQLKKFRMANPEAQANVKPDEVAFVNNNGDVLFQTNNITYNLYENNQAVNDAVSAQFQAVKRDDEVTAVSITAADKESVTFGRDDFEKLASKRVIEVEEKDEVIVPAQLTISKIVLDNSERKWEFVYQGTKIGAKLIDDDFWQKILNGQVSFANGDVLVADLKIIREYDQVLGAYLNKDYAVMNVRQHLPRNQPSQMSLEDVVGV